MPSRPAKRRWFQSCMVSPITGCPSACSMAATVDESTPPDMATAMVGSDIWNRKSRDSRERRRQDWQYLNYSGLVRATGFERSFCFDSGAVAENGYLRLREGRDELQYPSAPSMAHNECARGAQHSYADS